MAGDQLPLSDDIRFQIEATTQWWLSIDLITKNDDNFVFKNDCQAWSGVAAI